MSDRGHMSVHLNLAMLCYLYTDEKKFMPLIITRILRFLSKFGQPKNVRGVRTVRENGRGRRTVCLGASAWARF